MDTIDIIAVTAGVLFICNEVYAFMYARNVAYQAKIDAEIDRLSR
jgi:hypothetical protein